MTRTAPSEDKRQAILGAALALFGELGFHAANVPLIAAKAGVAVGTIYHYFPSKEAMVNALYRQIKQGFSQAILNGFPFAAPYKEQFMEYWRRLAAFVKTRAVEFSFMETHYHAPYLDKESRGIHLPLLEALGSAHAAAVDAGAVRPLAFAAVSAMTMGTMTALLKAANEEGLQLDEEFLTQTGVSLWRALAAKSNEREE